MHSFSYTNDQVLYNQFSPFLLCRVSWLPIITNLGSLSQIRLNEYQLKSISFKYNTCGLWKIFNNTRQRKYGLNHLHYIYLNPFIRIQRNQSYFILAALILLFVDNTCYKYSYILTASMRQPFSLSHNIITTRVINTVIYINSINETTILFITQHYSHIYINSINETTILFITQHYSHIYINSINETTILFITQHYSHMCFIILHH
jgi:hypothetical protein